MLDHRPTVFIGSSSEGLKYAKFLQEIFGDAARVTLWRSDEAFPANKSYFDALLDSASLCEFAVMVFTPDDATLKRKDIGLVPRDNVLFEFGLFLGKMGPRRAYALVENSIETPSDLAGISFDKFDAVPNKPGKPFRTLCENLRDRILKFHRNTAEFSQLPSTALAIGYFYNFLNRICEKLEAREPVIVDGGQPLAYKNYIVNIVIPENLNLLEKDAFRVKILQKLRPVKINNSSFRDAPFFMLADSGGADAGTLELFDVPTTLWASNETIKKIFKEEFVGISDLQKRAEEREIRNFEKTLQLILHEKIAFADNIRFRRMSEFLDN